MLRADMGALPMAEAIGLPYSSTVRKKDEEGVAHSCGHDMHVTWPMGAARLMAAHWDAWRGTLVAVVQPVEEAARDARSMIEDGTAKSFPKPDVIRGQHVMVGAAGTVGYRSGTVLSAGDSLKVKLIGRGSHGSTTLRLQRIQTTDRLRAAFEAHFGERTYKTASALMLRCCGRRRALILNLII